MKLLIIEDERKLSDSIVTYLSAELYLCEQAFTFDDAMSMLELYEYDCVLLDLMLPGGNGLDILRAIRSERNPAGVIIVSAKDSLEDKIKGLEIGADDYLAKPFHLPELSMRIFAVFRSKLDILLQQPDLTEGQAVIVQDLYQMTERLSHLNRNLLLLAKMENSQFSRNDSFDVVSVLNESLPCLESLAPGLTVRKDIQVSELLLKANKSLFESLVNNLIVNAVRHNKPNGEIIVTVTPDSLSVSNTSDDPPLTLPPYSPASTTFQLTVRVTERLTMATASVFPS